MDRWQAMRIFVRVAESASFSKTARHLRMSAPAVTRSVAALEDAIGARLFVRTTRSVKLTDAGARYLDDCRRILADIDEAEAAAAGSYAKPSGTLSVTAAALFGQMHVLPIVTAYLDEHPAMAATTLFVDRNAQLIDEGVDVAVRIGHLPDSGFAAAKVGSVRRVVVGSPAYFAEHGEPKTPAALKDHRVVMSTSAFASPEWRFGRGERVLVTPRLLTNTNEAAITTAVAGWGLTRVAHYQVGPALLRGALRIVLEDFEEPPLPVHVLYPEGRRAAAKVRTFVDFAVPLLRSNRVLNDL